MLLCEAVVIGLLCPSSSAPLLEAWECEGPMEDGFCFAPLLCWTSAAWSTH